MLIAMADESGISADANYFSMAAYVADHRVWAEFNVEWTAKLQKHGIEYLHMWEFAGRRGPFTGWLEERRRALMLDLLMAIMSRRLYAVGIAMRTADFRRLEAEIQEGLVGPYMICFYELSFGIGVLSGNAFPGEPVDFLYSRQDEFKRMMRRWWQFAKRTRGYGPRLGVLDFQDMRTVPGLQAADLLAWEFRHYYHLRDTHPDLRMRFTFRNLIEHQLWSQTKMLKYLPGWYIEFQAKGVHEASMMAMYTDLETWGPMYEELSAPLMESIPDLRRVAMLDKYTPYPGARPAFLEPMLRPVKGLPGFRPLA